MLRCLLTMCNPATTLCEKQGLTGTLLKGCIYDVVVSNDTALVEQETLKTGWSLAKHTTHTSIIIFSCTSVDLSVS